MMTAAFLLHEAGLQPSILLKLHKLRIHTLLDLLHYYPREYITYRCVTIPEIRVGDHVIIAGEIQQQLKLQQKGDYPYVLSMTATPIPCTLALTIHGDSDVSQIDELPPGRKPILTKVLTEKRRHKADEVIKLNLALNWQVYVILPLVEKSDKLDLQSTIAAHQRYQQQFSEYQVGLLHGRLSAEEKQTAQFRDNQIQILVSTTVVEVGVDVPNSAVIVIEHAERFACPSFTSYEDVWGEVVLNPTVC